MAEFLIKAVDATNPDKEKDVQGCYKRGDVVQVYEDGVCTEPPAPNSKMIIVKVPGMSTKDAAKYTESDIDMTDPDNPQTMRRRKNMFDLARLSPVDVASIEKDKQTTITVVSALDCATLKAEVVRR